MKEQITDLLFKLLDGFTREEISTFVEVPPNPDLGDYAFPCFRLAKTMRKAPQMIASELTEKLNGMLAENPVKGIDSVKSEGAYINFFLNKELLIEGILSEASKENYGSAPENGKTICIDYSSPNVAKNFHVGHLRTTIIGNSIYKIYSKLGYNVERINHLGDWGTQFGKLIVAYKNWGDEEAVKANGVEELMKLYVKFHDEAEKNPDLNEEARSWFHKMELGDEEALKIWQWFVDISLEEYKKTYALLGMDFDHFTGESFYRDMTDDVLKQLKDKNLTEESEGALIVPLAEYDMPPCIVLKNDGSSIYATRDIAAVLYRKRTYDFDKCLYVTGQEQKLHFKQVFKVVELLGNEWAATDLCHIPYGLVSLGKAKLSTRNGNVIYAEDILKDAIAKIRETIEEKNPELPDKDEVARVVGVGAVLFNDLYNQRIKDVSFDWDHLLNFDGETGPYVQYTYARCRSIIRKLSDYDENAEVNYNLITDPASYALVKEISAYPGIVQEAADRFEPSVVARYVVDLAQAFNKFYTDNRINVEDKELRNARVKLVSVTASIIKDALSLLGIGCVEQM